ncbi:MAG: hypothetical protein ABIO72_04475 [Patescibacteria group bacterium]
MDPMQPIAGISLEQHAKLSALMKDTGGDMEKCAQIAEANGVTRANWEEAMKGWQARMTDPAIAMQVATAFTPLYQKAMEEMRGGGEPLDIETYTKVVAEYSFEKDASGNLVPAATILARHGFDQTKWNEITSYWTPKVSNGADPSHAKFAELMQKESDRILGIQR